MAEAADVNVKVGADVSAAIEGFKKVSRAAGDLNSDLKALSKISKATGVSIEEVQGQLGDVVAKNQKKIGESVINNNLRITREEEKAKQKRIQLEQKQQYELAGLKQAELNREQKRLEKENAAREKAIAENNAIMARYDNQRAANAKKRADELESIQKAKDARVLESAQYVNGMRNRQDEKQRQYELTSLRDSIIRRNEADIAQRKNTESMINTLPRLRYALYDVANGFTNTSQVLLGFGKNVLDTTVQYETAFTNVERVTDMNAQQTARLREEFKALALQIPLTFQDISGIATLGAQLGVSENNLTNFTSTVSKFSAVTNVSNESAAQSFGALSELLNFAQADFEKFGASVAFAGSKSVATESEILSVATQIGGVAGAAGFSAEKVVGLSTALASLRVPAEQSRGALTRVFQEVNRAVSENGPQLQTFASILGMTSEEAANLARTDMSGFFDRFVQGLQGLNPQQITQALDALSLSDQRVTNTLSRLSSQYDVVTQSQAYATQGFQEGTFLAEAFATKADDLASKIQFLQNAISNLADTAGRSLSPIFGVLVDTLKNIIVGFEQFASSADGQFFIGIATAVTVLIGALAGLVAITLTTTGGVLALATAMFTIRGAATGSFASAIVGMIQNLTGLTISAGVATGALTALRLALLATGVGIAVVAVGAVAAGLAGAAATSKDAAKGTSNWAKTVANAQAKADALKTSTKGLNQEFTNIGSGGGGGSAGKAAEKIRTLKDYANDLSNIFSRAFELRFSSTQALDSISKSFASIAKSTADAREEINNLNADIQSLQADQALQEYFLSVATAYGDTLKAQEIRANLAKIDADLTSKTKSLQKAQDKTNKTLVGNSEAAIANRGEIINLVQQYQSYVKSLADSGMKQDELRAKAAQLKADFIAQATQLGYNSDELGIYTAAFDDLTFAINNVPRNISIGVDIDPNPAVTALNEILAAGQNAAGGIGGAFQQAGDDINAAVEATRQARIQASLYEDDIKSLSSTFQRFAPAPIKNTISPRGGRYFGAPAGGFADGGYTGAGGKYDVAGIVHRGEYVVPKEQVNQLTGLPYFMSQPRTFAAGGFTGQSGPAMVSLSPEDRALLRNAGGSGNIVLYADSRELARSVNDGNRQIVAQGGRP